MGANIRISVRNLIEFIYRHGDIDERMGSMTSAQEGTIIHKSLQKELGDKYSMDESQSFDKEVFLSRELEYEDVTVKLEGRADGIITKHHGDSIESAKIIEIKSTVKNIKDLEGNENFLHWAQGKLYCYLYCLNNEIKTIELELIYAHRETLETRSFYEIYTLEELENFFNEVMERYMVWIDLQNRWVDIRNTSIENLEFPFKTYRKGQRNLAMNIYRTIKEKKSIYVEAPTGTGKTISTLFPAIKSLLIYPESKITYLTAKNITKSVVEETLEILKKNSLHLRTLTLTAKDRVCYQEERKCNGDDCIYAAGHFDRVNDAIVDILNHVESITWEAIDEYSKKYKICPFEFSLDLISWSDLVICDYNYFFDPRAMIKRVEFDTTPYIFLIDEAHNLVDRARTMYSAEITMEVLKKAKETLKGSNRKLVSGINKIIKIMKEYAVGPEEFVIEQGPEEFLLSLRLLILQMEKFLKENQGSEISEDILDLYFAILDFERIGEIFTEDFVFYVRSQDKDIVLKIYCLNPAPVIEKCIEGNISNVFFSATLSPMGYYKELLGNGGAEYSMRLPSPFPEENRKLVVKTDVDTRYRFREKSYQKVVMYIHKYLTEYEGNFLVFFPSFDYMNCIYDIYIEIYGQNNIIVQDRSMDEMDRKEYLDRFNVTGIRTVGFAVLGGVFSEGIDLWGEKLKGAIIVGVGLPKVSFENRLIEEYFEKKTKSGFHYAYTFPGINKVIQAMGRVIRREEDKGIIVLMDSRYKDSIYKQLISIK